MSSLKKEFQKIHKKYQEKTGPKLDIHKLVIKVAAIIIIIGFVLGGAAGLLISLSGR